jgi:hypothetical protein
MQANKSPLPYEKHNDFPRMATLPFIIPPHADA